ncbi:PH domain-containing protein [Bacillus seohaeanensis]|uniref:PH domain-containing protein n=1 Tax=Bacillus seohaeanensis TaxID=284580 RepID=A0ABW5RL73_9BACI
MKVLSLLKKKIKEDEKIYFHTTGAFKGTTFGYLYVTEKQVVLVEVKPFGRMAVHNYEYSKFQNVDHDYAKLLGSENYMIYLKKSGLLGEKTERITHIPPRDFQDIYDFIKMQIR